MSEPSQISMEDIMSDRPKKESLDCVLAYDLGYKDAHIGLLEQERSARSIIHYCRAYDLVEQALVFYWYRRGFRNGVANKGK